MKTVIITGASSGIGKKMVEFFSQQDWKVIMVARSEDKLKKLEESYQNTHSWVCDLSNKESIATFKNKASDLGPIHALINNAGIYLPKSIDEDEDSVWEQQLQTNLLGAIRFTRLCWPGLKQAKGSILNISSTLGVRPIANTAAYSASKAAMNNWTLSLAIEGAPSGVRANAICPGIVDTPIHFYVESVKPEDQEIYTQVQSAQPLGRTGKPEDIASMALQLCSESSSWVTGTIINIDGGILLNS